MEGAPRGSPAGHLQFADSTDRSRLSRRARAGTAVRLAPGIYVEDARLAPEALALAHLYAIVGHVWPNAVVHGRSALAGGRPVDGELHVAHPDPPRRTALQLPGLRISIEVGPGPLPGDTPLPDGVTLAGPARTLVSNVPRRGRPPRSCAGLSAVEDRVDELAARGGADLVRRVLAQLDVIAGSHDPVQVATVRARLAAVLGTRSGGVRSRRLDARLRGQPFDARRLERLDQVIAAVTVLAPVPRPASGPADRFAWEPFFEAYFSNFIEGTEFGVQEARRIAIEGHVPTARPADAHDVAATHRLASDAHDRVAVPRTGDELVELLRERHARLLAARPDMRPGQLKERPNFAGGYRFVEPGLVRGTLREGFDRLRGVIDPMARALAMMVLVTECHPFDDGNGRVARLASNAELSHAGQVRVIVPTSFRDNYLAALSAISTGNGDGQSLHAVLDFAQRWVAGVDWRSFEAAHADAERTHAYLPPGQAELTGRRLRLP